MTVDFAQLYSQLGIRTDCSLEEFKHACRRRIRQQHPDRAGTGAMDDLDVATGIPLPELLPLYAKALRFHRKHGRLPGAAPAHATAASSREGGFPVAATAIASAPGASSSGTAPNVGTPRVAARGPLLLMLAIAVVLIGITAWHDDTPVPAQPSPIPVPDVAVTVTVTVADADAEPAQATPKIEIGMDMQAVREIQGEPVQQEGSRWFYGPSWLYFEDDHLVDWYSSPLYPLKTATSSPADGDME